MLYDLAAVAGLDGEAFRSGVLLETERRVPSRAGRTATASSASQRCRNTAAGRCPRAGELVDPIRNSPKHGPGSSSTRQGPAKELGLGVRKELIEAVRVDETWFEKRVKAACGVTLPARGAGNP